MTLLIVVGCLVAYFVVGLLIGAAALPQSIRSATAVTDRVYGGDKCPNYPVGHKGLQKGDVCRKCVGSRQYLVVFLWPAMGPAALIRRGADRGVDKVDPAVRRQQQERIRDLERQLDIR